MLLITDENDKVRLYFTALQKFKRSTPGGVFERGNFELGFLVVSNTVTLRLFNLSNCDVKVMYLL